MNSTSATNDAINEIHQVQPGDRIDQLRNCQPLLTGQLQDYYRSIFEPDKDSAAAFSLLNRCLVAVRVSAHTGSRSVMDWYAALAHGAGASPTDVDRVRNVGTGWTDESQRGAAIRHVDLLTTQPAAAQKRDLDALKEAGFTPAGVVSLSQTIAFVSYQLRLIAALRALGSDAQ